MPRDPRTDAADPSSPAATLRELAASGDPEVRQQVAANPNAPLSLLLTLALQHADQVLDNAAFALALIDQPDLISRAPPPVCAAFAASPRLPGWMASELFAAARFDVLAALAANAAVPTQLLLSLACHGSPGVRARAASNPALPTSLLLTLLADLDVDVRRSAAASPGVPDEWRARLARLGLAGDLTSLPARLASAARPDLVALLEIGGWFHTLLALCPELPSDLATHLARTPGEHHHLLGLRSGLPPWLLDSGLLRLTPPDEVRQTYIDPVYPVLPYEPSEPLLTPSLRGPVVIGQWLAAPGEEVDAGVPLVELLCLVSDAVVRVRSPGRARVLWRRERGAVAPGETLMRLSPLPPASEPSPASRRILALEAQGPPAGANPPLLALPTRMLLPAPITLAMPLLGESMTEGTLYNWEVRPWQLVQSEQVLVTVGLDKCDVELRAPHGGLVIRCAPEGDVIAVGSPYALLLPLPER